MTDEMRPLQRIRSCGHMLDAILFWTNPSTGLIEVICVPCLAKKAGLAPAEILAPDTFVNKYGELLGLK